MLDRLFHSLGHPLTLLRLSGSAVLVVLVATALLHWRGLLPPSADDGLIAASFQMWTGRLPDARPYAVLELLLTVVYGIGFWFATDEHWPERHPRRALAVLVLLDMVALTTANGLTFILTALVGASWRPRAALLFTLVQVLINALCNSMTAGEEAQLQTLKAALSPWGVYLLVLLVYLSLHGFALGLGRLVARERERRLMQQLMAAELASQERLQLEQVRFAERLELGRELHDLMGHHLAALSISLQLSRELAQRSGQAGLQAPLDSASLAAQRLLAEVRETVSTVRGSRRIDLSAALQELASRIERPRVLLQVDEIASDLPPRVAHVLLRCVQEAVTNSVRHASAAQVRVSITRHGGELVASVADDGRGAPALVFGNGLSGMQERLHELGGRLAVLPGAPGLEVRMMCPLGA
ncbi:sensor histidine kinase [Eleftheria terrae]|uniref:sensor histidine kinase n=1 Tax=Eleftheria terrae TaxID=1597781 RepID=UPI00263AD451|nr:histidine kinase [Eleftheria terrae]WKB51631.1 histidine kinase [Eleftheria terrae]